MTPQEQRIAIAEACGWKNVAPQIVKNVKHEGDDTTVGIWSDSGWVPDYLNDLNAIHEAEKVLNTPTHMQKHAWNNYKAMLEEATRGSSFHATAKQRSKAFLTF